MYSPFSDSKGRPLTIEKVKFSHLSQLVDCDEGHHVEYKLLLEDGGKAQLAKEITSFANCEGGWLIVGIDDKTKEIKDFACAEALEGFYADNEYTYYWSCMKNDYMVVKYNSGYEETISVALKNGAIKIDDLDRFNISYIKYEK